MMFDVSATLPWCNPGCVALRPRPSRLFSAIMETPSPHIETPGRIALPRSRAKLQKWRYWRICLTSFGGMVDDVKQGGKSKYCDDLQSRSSGDHRRNSMMGRCSHVTNINGVPCPAGAAAPYVPSQYPNSYSSVKGSGGLLS